MRYTEDLEVRDPGLDEVKIRMVASGICHSDISVINGTIDWAAPAVLGHEGAGIIDQVGSAVLGLKPGDPVIIHNLAYCGHCRHCDSGKPTRCRSTLGNRTQPFMLDGQPVSNFAASSTFAEYTVVKQQQAIKVAPDIRLDIACVVACGVVTGVGSVLQRAKVDHGDTAAVFGVGGVGLNVVQGLRIAGASRIIAVDLLAGREKRAREFGATDFIDATYENVNDRIRELLPDPLAMAAGVDWAFECSGSPVALSSAIASLGWGGNCVIVGVPAVNATVDLPIASMTIVDRGVIGARYGTLQPHRDIRAYLDLYRNGLLKLDELVTKRYALDQFEEAFHDLESGKLARGVFVF
jgi:S-(hydroxymethyl)glutathione dehydrogenase/alcohol dehydrogenase